MCNESGKNKRVKIAIATKKMVMGGIEKSLITLCRQLIDNNAEVTLYLEETGGELYDEIPKEVKIINVFSQCESLLLILKNKIKKRKFKQFFWVVYVYLNNIFNGDPIKSWLNTTKYLDITDDEYDYAFAYGAPISFSLVLVKEKIDSKKKYAWIHNDVENISLNITDYSYLFSSFDRIVCVSEMAKRSFVKYLPEYQNKTSVFYNIIDKEFIIKQSYEYEYDNDFKGVRLLTVGRLCFEKGQDIIPNVVKKLLKSGYNIKWYCIGDGDYKEKLEKQILSYDIQSNLVLLGNLKNPYPLFRTANIYVQTSRNEGFGLSISEAKLFNLPIITTNTVGANEQIVNEETGVIVDYNDNDIYNAIVLLLNNEDLMKKFVDNLNIDNKSCVSKMEELIY